MSLTENSNKFSPRYLLINLNPFKDDIKHDKTDLTAGSIKRELSNYSARSEKSGSSETSLHFEREKEYYNM